MIVAIVAGIVIIITIGVALYASHGHSKNNISEFLVGGRSFPAWLVFFLAVGEVYSIGTLLGFPGGIYTKGASYGVWFIGYILLAYVFGYFWGPLIWRAGKKYDAMTPPDILRHHYDSPTLEIVACVAMLIALIPWGMYQFIGLQAVLQLMGLNLSPVQTMIISGVLAFIYVAVSGVRSPAFISLIKDTLMVFAVVAVGVGALFAVGKSGVQTVSTEGALSAAMTTIRGSSMTFTISTVLFQAMVFYLALGISYLLPAKSEAAVKTATVWMPLYMLIYPLLTFVSFFALRHYPAVKNPNTIFMVVARAELPDWALGLVASGALLSGLLVLAVTALSIGALVTRNLLPHDLPSNVQRRWSTLFVAVFLVVAALLNLYAAQLMLIILTIFYGLAAQLAPSMVAVLFVRRLPAAAITVGMVVGVVLSVVLYLHGPQSIGGLNSGVISTGANVLILLIWRLVAPGAEREPIVLHRLSEDRAKAPASH
jgi:SSS family solute:Na+ symporter